MFALVVPRSELQEKKRAGLKIKKKKGKKDALAVILEIIEMIEDEDPIVTT